MNLLVLPGRITLAEHKYIILQIAIKMMGKNSSLLTLMQPYG